MNVLVIPEDFRKDQYVLLPIVKAMLQHLGRSSTKIRVCQDPLLGSVHECLKWRRIKEILEKYAWGVDLFLLCVDRDGDKGRRSSLDHLEELAAHALPAGKLFVAENAWQEIEVWVLAGHDLPPEWSWREIRAEVNPKEIYFLPFAEKLRLLDEPGEGRKTLTREAAGRYTRIRQFCPEDIGSLEDRIRVWLR